MIFLIRSTHLLGDRLLGLCPSSFPWDINVYVSIALENVSKTYCGQSSFSIYFLDDDIRPTYRWTFVLSMEYAEGVSSTKALLFLSASGTVELYTLYINTEKTNICTNLIFVFRDICLSVHIHLRLPITVLTFFFFGNYLIIYQGNQIRSSIGSVKICWVV